MKEGYTESTEKTRRYTEIFTFIYPRISAHLRVTALIEGKENLDH